MFLLGIPIVYYIIISFTYYLSITVLTRIYGSLHSSCSVAFLTKMGLIISQGCLLLGDMEYLWF